LTNMSLARRRERREPKGICGHKLVGLAKKIQRGGKFQNKKTGKEGGKTRPKKKKKKKKKKKPKKKKERKEKKSK